MAGRPFLRPLLVWIFGALALALSVCLCFLLAPFLGGPGAFWLVAPRYIRGTARAFGIRRELEGWEALPHDLRSGARPAVFIGNHTSLFDPPLMISTLPCRPVFVAKRELARVPFLGWVIWLADFIFIDRRDRNSALASLEEAAIRIHAGQPSWPSPKAPAARTGTCCPSRRVPSPWPSKPVSPWCPSPSMAAPTSCPRALGACRGGLTA